MNGIFELTVVKFICHCRQNSLYWYIVMRVWFSGKILASQAEVASSILVTRFELRNRSTLIAERVRNGVSRINRLAGAPQAHNHIVHFSSASLRRFGGAIRKNESGTADITVRLSCRFLRQDFFLS